MPSQYLTMNFDLALPAYISDDKAALEYIEKIDMRLLKERLVKASGWTAAESDAAERRYKNWLALVRKHRGENLPPPPDVDAIWHGHILETPAYHRDTQALFGGYLHHSPYFGERGPEDEAALAQAMQQTGLRWREQYGESLV